MQNGIFTEADLLLPDFQKTDGSRYAVIACDQFTSEPLYWEEAERLVADAPSTLGMILPECYLALREEKIPAINRTMESLLAEGFFLSYPQSILYLCRTLPDGRIRRGLVGACDLEAYGFLPEDRLPIRATEGTVLERIPPRVEIRRDAPLELPHVMLLMDDREDTVFSRVVRTEEDRPLYDFPLMAEGGHVRGYLLTDDEKAAIDKALSALSVKDETGAPLLFAVGDGNHSLATAKTCYTELKARIGAEAAARHPARYALVELVNLHDEALDFEPIFRVVMGADADDLVASLRDYTERAADASLGTADFTVIAAGHEEKLTLKGTHVQPVGTLQAFLDVYTAAHPEVTVDYIHDEDSLRALSVREGAVGFLFRGMKKEDLFPAILRSGPLPRKTFSMGHARDKRYYLEARRIRP